jgi:Antirestriction protein
MNDTTQETRITRALLDDRDRMAVPAKLFGVMFTTRVEPFVFGIARSLSADYDGGYWEFYALSNGGFYMAPSGEHQFAVRCENGYAGEMSGDALGIVCCLYAYSHLTFSRPGEMAEACARQYHLLREWMLAGHGEAREILAATD